MQKPVWKFWRAMPEVKLWQAIALSLNLDPDLLNPDYIDNDSLELDEHGGWNGDASLSVTELSNFSKRLRLLVANISDKKQFSAGTLNISNRALHGVRLNEFAVWCLQKSFFDCPEPILELGHRLQYECQEKQKRDAGRYTLEAAADAIAQNTGERKDDLQKKLEAAALSGQLPMYEPGKSARYTYGQSRESRVRAYYEEAYWRDLNHWLNQYEPRIYTQFFQFPEPVIVGHVASSRFSEIAYNGKSINWVYWIHQMPSLTAGEAALLMNALDPSIFNIQNSLATDANPIVREAFEKAQAMLRLAERQGRLQTTPREWLEWANAHNFKLHSGFILAIEELPQVAVPEMMQHDEPNAQDDSNDKGNVTDDWIAKARAIAGRIGLERFNNGQQQITGRNVAAAVANELASDTSTHGRLGPRGDDNVRNEGLRGWTFIPPKDK